jgi:hypothetical protein
MLDEGHPNCYVSVSMASNVSFNAMFWLVTTNKLQILELYLNRRFKQEKF